MEYHCERKLFTLEHAFAAALHTASTWRECLRLLYVLVDDCLSPCRKYYSKRDSQHLTLLLWLTP